MARAFAALSEVVRMVETGALEIRTPDDDDPALVTAIQFDGDIVCSIYARRAGHAGRGRRNAGRAGRAPPRRDGRTAGRHDRQGRRCSRIPLRC